jgi:cation diffusion facilitator CzcD-associated flavoprotein CzcO
MAVASERRPAALQALAARAREDLARLNHPPANWVLPAQAPGGQPVLDVLVVGAGMCGQTAAFALLREGVANLRVIDAAPRGDEGPWGTFARMTTLRSPKHLTGPDLGVPSLTFRSWYEAQHGADGWAALHKVGRLDWRDYLLWVRDTPASRSRTARGCWNWTNRTAWLARACARRRATRPCWRARSCWRWAATAAAVRAGRRYPSLDPADPATRGRVFHSADAIDFDALRGKRVGVLGAGASAFDNAGARWRPARRSRCSRAGPSCRR